MQYLLLANPAECATVVYDHRVTDDDAHYRYGVNHARSAVVAARPDLSVGVSVFPEDVGTLEISWAYSW